MARLRLNINDFPIHKNNLIINFWGKREVLRNSNRNIQNKTKSNKKFAKFIWRKLKNFTKGHKRSSEKQRDVIQLTKNVSPYLISNHKTNSRCLEKSKRSKQNSIGIRIKRMKKKQEAGKKISLGNVLINSVFLKLIFSTITNRNIL